MTDLSSHDLELVHRYFDGELNADELMMVERLLEDDPDARAVLLQLRQIGHVARIEALSASYQEDFSNWWDAVEQQIEDPSLEPPAGSDPIRHVGPVSIIEGEIRESPRAGARRWTAALIALLVVGMALGVLLLTTR
jgi:anti-sigma factor RsiW